MARITPMRRFLVSLIRSPLLWGAVATAVLYRLIPVLPVYRELAERYLCGHPLEYATTALFLLAMATLVLKLLRVRREWQALETMPVLDSSVFRAGGAQDRAKELQAKLTTAGEPLAHSELGRRIRDVCDFVRGRGSAEGLEEHLKYLAELAAERLHRSYALVRTVTWAVPILGFLGTVVGITMAIAKVTPEQLDTSLDQVTGGLAVAFDTTALALTLSLLLVFASFVVERAEQLLLARVEEFGSKQLLLLFPPDPPSVGRALLSAEQEAAQKLLQQTDTLIRQQAKLWSDGLESLRVRWQETLESQQSQLQQALQQSLQTTVQAHAESVHATQAELLDAVRAVSGELKETLQRWQNAVNENNRGLQDLHAELRSQAEVLLVISRETDRLNRLQAALAENLQIVRAAETFEQTLHSLSAAVHLLTARTSPSSLVADAGASEAPGAQKAA